MSGKKKQSRSGNRIQQRSPDQIFVKLQVENCELRDQVVNIALEIEKLREARAGAARAADEFPK